METPKYKPHVNIGKIKCDGRGGFLGQLPKDYPSEREMLQDALQQISQLKADKEELLSALEETNRRISIIKSEPDGIVRETMIDMLPIGIESLIQKHKQCGTA